MHPLSVFLVQFAFIFLKAFQQRNVAFMHYGWVMPISALMAVTEVYVVSAVALNVTKAESFLAMWPIVLAIAGGSGLGCICAMYLHHRFLKERPNGPSRTVPDQNPEP